MPASQDSPDLSLERELLARPVGGLMPSCLVAFDEVGRGAVAGPLCVGAALVTAEVVEFDGGLHDSKRLTPAARVRLVPQLQRWLPCHAVGSVSAAEVDQLGVSSALRLAARRALHALQPGGVWVALIDGPFDWLCRPAPVEAEPVVCEPAAAVCVKRADATCQSVAAASVFAKVWRDQLMAALDDPGYGFAAHVGYGTARHFDALRNLGLSSQHRRSFLRRHLAGV